MTTMTIKSVDRADQNLILVTDYDYERRAIKRVKEVEAVHDFLCGLFKPLLEINSDSTNTDSLSSQQN
jgi:hypothetical protein